VGGPGAGSRAGEEGIALVLVVVCLAVLGLVAAGSLALALAERQGAAHLLYATQAEYAAEAGTVLPDSLRPVADSLRSGNETALGRWSLPGQVVVTDTLRRLNDQVFLLRATGARLASNGNPLGWRRLGRLLRRERPAFSPSAALSAATATGMGGATVSGSDSIPPDWVADCPPPGPSIADTRLDSLAAPVAATSLGDASIGRLLAQAGQRVGGALSSLEPLPGGSSLVIAARDGTQLSSGSGRGLLIVDGDLEIAGGFEFRGLILVMGTARFTGLGGVVLGALVARQVDLGGSPTLVTFSRCAVERALDGAARLEPLHDRSWLELP
jgi:hypothetical protein